MKKKTNIVTKLRYRETTNIKQRFQYTKQILESLTKKTDIVVPIRDYILPTTSRLLRALESFFRCHYLPTSFGYENIKLFTAKAEHILCQKRYLLIYGYTGDKKTLDFNTVHKDEFTTVLLLQEGKPLD